MNASMIKSFVSAALTPSWYKQAFINSAKSSGAKYRRGDVSPMFFSMLGVGLVMYGVEYTCVGRK